jgi:hypothetical protein
VARLYQPCGITAIKPSMKSKLQKRHFTQNVLGLPLTQRLYKGVEKGKYKVD